MTAGFLVPAKCAIRESRYLLGVVKARLLREQACTGKDFLLLQAHKLSDRGHGIGSTALDQRRNPIIRSLWNFFSASTFSISRHPPHCRLSLVRVTSRAAYHWTMSSLANVLASLWSLSETPAARQSGKLKAEGGFQAGLPAANDQPRVGLQCLQFSGIVDGEFCVVPLLDGGRRCVSRPSVKLHHTAPRPKSP
jgi:hypothetical protein